MISEEYRVPAGCAVMNHETTDAAGPSTSKDATHLHWWFAAFLVRWVPLDLLVVHLSLSDKVNTFRHV